MNRNRRAAFLILKKIEKEESYSNLAVNEVLSAEPADSPAFVREIVYGVLRNQLLLDYNIDRFLTGKKLNYALRIILRMGFYELSFMDAVPDHAVVSETVSLAAAFKKGSQGLVNAVLRNYIRAGKPVVFPDPADEKHLSVRYSCSADVAELLVGSYGREKAEEILEAYLHPLPVQVRRNSLKKGSEDLKEEDLRADSAAFRNGMFHFQGEASQMACRLLAPKPGDTVIDMCAAPGGKTATMAEMMENKGVIYAFDLYEHRVRLIEKNAERLGIGIIKARAADAGLMMPELCGTADCVLADVPCSGLGVAANKPELKLKNIAKETKDLPKLQLCILHNAASYVKMQGGKLLYSTCTINPAENRQVVDDFLRECPEFEIASEKLLLPGKTDGFYMCLLRRQDDQCRF